MIGMRRFFANVFSSFRIVTGPPYALVPVPGNKAKPGPTVVNASRHIAVGIITHKRPAGLAKLLAEVAKQKQVIERPFEMSVVVVDNDAEGSARSVVESVVATTNLQLLYAVEPKLGIPFARNKVLQLMGEHVDLVAFIDDDEWPTEHWLDEMLKVHLEAGAHCVWGPVNPSYPEDAPKFFVKCGVFDGFRISDRTPLPFAASGNVLFDRRFVAERNLKFNEDLRYSGGTDIYFFGTAWKMGMQIRWCEKGIVMEQVPKSRMNWKWVVLRQFRIGTNEHVCDVAAGKKGFSFACGVTRLICGTLMVPFALISRRALIMAMVSLMRGAGRLAGLWGLSVNEYSPEKLSAHAQSPAAPPLPGEGQVTAP